MKAILKKTIGFSLYTLYLGLNVVFFKKKKRIVFISFPDATDNSWYLYCYALTHLEGYELVWLISESSPNIKEKILKQYQSFPNSNKVIIAKRWNIKSLALFSSSKYVFHTHGSYYFIKSAMNAPTIVNLWHGMPIKAIGHLDKSIEKNFCYSDYSIATSEYYREIISKAFDLPIAKVLKTGLPRNDVLFKRVSQEIEQELLSTLSINLNEKILVWLPTYRASQIGDIRNDGTQESFLNDLDSDFLSKLNSLSSQKSIKIFIKLHPMDKLNGNISEYNFSNISFFDSNSWQSLNIELYDLISISNGIVSDFSSVIIDCISTTIPIGFMASSRDTYTRKTLFSIENISQYINYINKPEDFISLVNHERNSENKVNNFNDFGDSACNKLFKVLGVH